MAPVHPKANKSTTLPPKSVKRQAQLAPPVNSDDDGEHQDENYEDEDANAQPTSQTSEDGDIQRLVRKMTESTRRRRAAKRTDAEAKYFGRLSATECEIIKLQQEHRRRVAQLYQSKLDRLNQLTKQRAEIEAKIIASVTKLERAYAGGSGVMLAAVRGRVEGIE